MSATLISEETINKVTDLFGAFKLLKQFDISSNGVTDLEDAKCRLLGYMKQLGGNSDAGITGGEDLMEDVIQLDQRNREGLACLYESAYTYLSLLPASQRKEISQAVPQYETQLSARIDSLRDGQCGILVAGEVSAGKSSLLNLLLGTDLFPTSLLSCTSVLCELKHSDKKYATAYPSNSSRHQHIIDLSCSDPAACLAKYVHQKDDRQAQFTWDKVSVFWPFPLLKGGVYIVDSPGIGESRHMTEKVKQYIPSAFAFIYVINSTNAGGLQRDRLQDLLEEFNKKSEEKPGAQFDPKSAIFVCNKWDQVPVQERDAVYRDTVSKLQTCWPGLTEDQVFCMSTNSAMKFVKECNYITSDYRQLLEGIRKLLPTSLQCKLESHYRWLSFLLQRTDFSLRVFIANQTRTDEERRDLTEQLHHQLDKLESDTKRVRQELQLELRKQTSVVCDHLIAHLASASTRNRLLTWQAADCPDGSDWDLLEEALANRVHRRLRKEVADWDMKNCVFLELELNLIQKFQQEFELMEDQLSIVEGKMLGRGIKALDATSIFEKQSLTFPPGLLTTKQKVLLGLAVPILLPLSIITGIVLFPIAGMQALKSKMQDLQQLKVYRDNKTEYMATLTDEILEEFLKRNNLSKLIQDQLKQVSTNVDLLFKSIPNIVEADRILIRKLQGERENLETALVDDYIPLHLKCQEILGSLNYLYITSIRQYDLTIQDLKLDLSDAPISSGSYGDVYRAALQKDGKEQEVAVKIRHESVQPHNATEVLLEEENLRRLRNDNIVQLYGTTVRRSEDSVQLIIIMELCPTTLLSKIIGPEAVNPGKLGPKHPRYSQAWRKIYALLVQVCHALKYLHERSFVHRDLRPQNILLKNDTVRLADLGLTKPEHDISGVRCGSVCYTGPEVLEGHEYGKAADIFSLGVIVWELWYGRLAQDELAALHRGDVDTGIRRGIRPSLVTVHEPPESLRDMIKSCWHQSPKHRPSAECCYTYFST